MAYFGGAGVGEELHPSLKAYIDCFKSAPFPKMFPRGGGPHDQDPLLMRDFRIIRTHEIQWKETQEQMSELKGKSHPGEAEGGGGSDLDDALNQYIDEMGLDEDDVF